MIHSNELVISVTLILDIWAKNMYGMNWRSYLHRSASCDIFALIMFAQPAKRKPEMPTLLKLLFLPL